MAEHQPAQDAGVIEQAERAERPAQAGTGFGRGGLTANGVLALQRSVGNRAVGRVIAGERARVSQQALARSPEPEVTEPAARDPSLVPPARDEEGNNPNDRIFFLPGKRGTDAEMWAAIREWDPVLVLMMQDSTTRQEDDWDVYVHPSLGDVAKVNRAYKGQRRVWFAIIPGIHVVRLVNTGTPDAPRGKADPFVDLYLREFPDATVGTDGPPTQRLDDIMRIRLALRLCDETLAGEMATAFVETISDPWFYIMTGGTIGFYVGLWLVPDPTFVSKLAAAGLTWAFLMMFSWTDLWGFALAWLELNGDVRRATTEDELKAAGDAFLTKLGPIGVDILLMFAFHRIGESSPVKGAREATIKKVRMHAAKQARVAAEADLANARKAPGSGSKAAVDVAPPPDRADIVTKARAEAGPNATPDAVLDEVSRLLPDAEAREALAQMRASGTDPAALLNKLERMQAAKDVRRFVLEERQSPEAKLAAKQAVADAEAAAAIARLRELAVLDDPALRKFLRAAELEQLKKLLGAKAAADPRVAKAIRDGNVADVRGALGEALARAELRRRLLPGQEVRSDLEVTRRVPGVTTIAEWKAKAMAEWEAGGRTGPKPNEAKMRQHDNEVWESIGQADNAIVDPTSGKTRFVIIEEVKTGTERQGDALAQVEKFKAGLKEIRDGNPDVRLFQKSGRTTLGADVTNSYHPASGVIAEAQARGPSGQGYANPLGYTPEALDTAAREIIRTGVPPPEPALGPRPSPPVAGHDRRDAGAP